MAKIALAAPAAMVETTTAQDTSQANPTTTTDPSHSTQEGSIFEDLAFIGALLFGVDDAETGSVVDG